ncbi:hypothetical protein [Microbulbifer aggregans]|uniref:hypothetical protein n=1 Tax=Microbulbifer aggregans TaxID=1769779 RepID=UPI001CFDCEE9|nr:hypothetical protein [Microbulbifer aggregans]
MMLAVVMFVGRRWVPLMRFWPRFGVRLGLWVRMWLGVRLALCVWTGMWLFTASLESRANIQVRAFAVELRVVGFAGGACSLCSYDQYSSRRNQYSTAERFGF